MLTLAKQLPKVDLFTALVKLGVEPCPLPVTMAITPAYLKACLTFIGEDRITASTAVVVWQDSRLLQRPFSLLLQNGKRETVVMQSQHKRATFGPRLILSPLVCTGGLIPNSHSGPRILYHAGRAYARFYERGRVV